MKDEINARKYTANIQYGQGKVTRKSKKFKKEEK